MIVCIFEHVQWRWALNDRLAHATLAAITMAPAVPPPVPCLAAMAAPQPSLVTATHCPLNLGFGRIVASGTEVPNMLVNLV